ncbi:hypothetical protein ACIBEF_31550 [Micromonospora sp. NPDC050795]|uniref:hypothetical protein n=1 Tax=Micromonospora sp. NPDC050795 TaxID=3364282 RepID=UPI0037BCC97C
MKLRLISGEAESSTYEEATPFWRQRRWQLSAAFLAITVCGGAASMIGGGGGSGAGTATSGPIIGDLDPDGSRPQQCRTDDSEQGIPATAPQDVTWWPLNGASTPQSASAGPLRTIGPLRWCFAHTPMGAVMAANVIPRQMSGPDWRTVTHQQLVPGFSRDYYESMRESLLDTGSKPTTNALAGFMVVDYSPARAIVRILVRQAAVAYVSVDYTVVWDGVDWKLRPQSTGGLYTEVKPVLSLTGYVLWKKS